MQPEALFGYFLKICEIPHGSKNEAQISAYLQNFGKELGFETIADGVGNVLIKKPATPGYENRKTIILQSHMDMVCDKRPDVAHDFTKDPIKTWVDGEWLKAQGTTLGADNGVGVAAAIAVLAVSLPLTRRPASLVPRLFHPSFCKVIYLLTLTARTRAKCS